MIKLKKSTIFTPAFDKRDPDPAKDGGIRGVYCYMILHGRVGVVSFCWDTGILLPSTIEGFIKEGTARYKLETYGRYSFLNKPSGHDVSYHSPVPLYEGQDLSHDHCLLIGNKPCFSGGSGLYADEWFDILVEKGSDPIWDMLSEYYHETFKIGIK